MRTTAGVLAFTTALSAAASAAGDPPVPLGRDPGGPAVALIGSGIDYTRGDIASALARDGEGELIGWDFVDNDARPFTQTMDTSAAAMARSLALVGSRLVPVRIDEARPDTLAQAIAFVARTPARSAWFFTGPLKRSDWQLFRQAMQMFSNLKIQVPRCVDPEAKPAPPGDDALILPEQLGLANVSALPCQSRP
ncbi:MAG: hypothetical protein ACT4N2_01070 [Hyphomicrobium sp.]